MEEAKDQTHWEIMDLIVGDKYGEAFLCETLNGDVKHVIFKLEDRQKLMEIV